MTSHRLRTLGPALRLHGHPTGSPLRRGALRSGRAARAHADALPLCPGLRSPCPSSSIWLLLKNPTFVLLCLAGATEATLIAGMSTFGPKFLESQFSLSASDAATLFGEESRRVSGVPCFFASPQTPLLGWPLS